MSKTRLKQGQDFSNVSKKIEKQGIELRSGYCVNGPMGVSSPISKTMSKMAELLQCV